jgi:lipoate---protein ligase
MDVQDGIIHQIKIFGDYFNTLETSEFENILTGCRHTKEGISRQLEKIDINAYFRGFSPEDVLAGLF